jgi:hypothetical protein
LKDGRWGSSYPKSTTKKRKPQSPQRISLGSQETAARNQIQIFHQKSARSVECEFSFSLLKLMSFSVLLFCRLFKFGEDFYHEFIHVWHCLWPLFQLPLCPPALALRALCVSLLVWGLMSGACIFGCGYAALCSLWFGGGSGLSTNLDKERENRYFRYKKTRAHSSAGRATGS